MRKSLYGGNLARETTADDLAEAVGRYGTVARAQVVTERDTGQSRGFGFVEMTDGSEKAIANLNGAQLQGRMLTVNEAKPRVDRLGGQGGRRRYSPACSGRWDPPSLSP